jgi:hypothetical protein
VAAGAASRAGRSKADLEHFDEFGIMLAVFRLIALEKQDRHSQQAAN